MIEAVNSSVVNSQVLRGNAEQPNAASAAVAAAEVAESVSAPQAPFVSPYIFVDTNVDKAVLQIRDGETGDVLTQYPSKSRLQEQQRANAAQQTQADQSTQGGSISQVSVEAQAQQQDFPSQDVAQLQQASVALANGAQAGVSVLSAGVNVQA